MAGLLAGMTASTACGEKATDTASSASAKPGASGETKSAPAKTEEAKPLTVAQFTTDAPAAACKALVACKNQEISVGLGTTLLMIGAFGSMDDPAAGKEFKSIDESMKKDSRYAMNSDECGKVMGIVTKATGFTAEKIQASIDAKKAAFDPGKAATCMAALAKEPTSCSQEKKVEKEPKMGDLDKMMDSYKKELEDYMKPCESVIDGKVAEGGECAYDFECAGEKVSCKQKKCSKKAG